MAGDRSRAPTTAYFPKDVAPLSITRWGPSSWWRSLRSTGIAIQPHLAQQLFQHLCVQRTASMRLSSCHCIATSTLSHWGFSFILHVAHDHFQHVTSLVMHYLFCHLCGFHSFGCFLGVIESLRQCPQKSFLDMLAALLRP